MAYQQVRADGAASFFVFLIGGLIVIVGLVVAYLLASGRMDEHSQSAQMRLDAPGLPSLNAPPAPRPKG